MEASSQVGTSEELEAKRKARMERFGAAEVKEPQRSATTQKQQHGGDKGKSMNSRKAKLMRKLAEKQGGEGGGKKSIIVGGG